MRKQSECQFLCKIQKWQKDLPHWIWSHLKRRYHFTWEKFLRKSWIYLMQISHKFEHRLFISHYKRLSLVPNHSGSVIKLKISFDTKLRLTLIMASRLQPVFLISNSILLFLFIAIELINFIFAVSNHNNQIFIHGSLAKRFEILLLQQTIFCLWALKKNLILWILTSFMNYNKVSIAENCDSARIFWVKLSPNLCNNSRLLILIALGV